MSKATFITNKGESRSCYRLCVPPCPRYITSGDTHSLCMVCLGVKHAESALEGTGCPHCERLPLRTLRREPSPAFLAVLAPFQTRWSGGCICGVHSWIWIEMGRSLSSSSPARSTARSLGSEARSAVSSP